MFQINSNMYNNKYPNILRTGGRYPSNRFGICFKTLSKQQRRLLMDHPLLKERVESDQFVHILFEVCRFKNTQHRSKYFYDWSTKEPMLIDDLKDSYDTIDWTCAISGEAIRSNINNFDTTNFVHPDHHDILSESMIDSRIVQSSIAFKKHVKKLLLNQQKEFLKLARKSSKN